MMFFQSRLFKFLLALFSYLFFVFLWVYNYAKLWYNNVPEETDYLRAQTLGTPAKAAMVGYTFLATLIIFLILGTIYLAKTSVSKILIFALMGNMVISVYCIWIYATKLMHPWSNNLLFFLNIVLFAVSIFQLIKPERKARINQTRNTD